MLRLGLNERNPDHKHLYHMMKVSIPLRVIFSHYRSDSLTKFSRRKPALDATGLCQHQTFFEIIACKTLSLLTVILRSARLPCIEKSSTSISVPDQKRSTFMTRVEIPKAWRKRIGSFAGSCGMCFGTATTATRTAVKDHLIVGLQAAVRTPAARVHLMEVMVCFLSSRYTCKQLRSLAGSSGRSSGASSSSGKLSTGFYDPVRNTRAVV